MGLRVLHTSDWHLGHVLHGVERDHEHQAFLDWLLGVIDAEKVDALLIAGDIFDTANPAASATALWYRFLARAHARAPQLQVVVIGGNHDSAARLEAPRPLLSEIGPLHVVGALPRLNGATDVERLLVPLFARDGQVAAWVVAMPFLRPADLPVLDGASDSLVEGTRVLYKAAFDALEGRRAPEHAVIAMGHCYMVGCQISELSERKVLGGNQHPLPTDIFGSAVSYVALGHLHSPQQVGHQEAIRYSGSALPLSFDERENGHSVALVDFEGSRLRSVRKIPVPRSVDLLSIPPDGPRIVEEVLALIKALPQRGETPESLRPLLEIRVKLDKPEPMLRKLIEDAVQGKEARLVRIAPPLFTGAGPGLESSGVQSLSELTPEQAFRLRYAQRHEDQPAPDLLAAFHELHDQVGQEDG